LTGEVEELQGVSAFGLIWTQSFR